MPVAANKRKAATLFCAVAVIVLCVGAVLVVPLGLEERISSSGDEYQHSSLQTSDSQGPDIFELFQQQQHQESPGSISDKSRLASSENSVPAPAPSMIVHAAPTLEPSKAPTLGSDYPSIVPAQWGTVAPTAGWQQLVTEKGRHHAIKVKRQRRLRESYHEELRKRRLMGADTKSNTNNNKDNNNKARTMTT
jgi:hypothetical protein